MGNADVQISLADDGQATAGSKLKGSVVLNVIRGGIPAVSLEIHFWGREWAEVEWYEDEEIRRGDETETRRVRRSESSRRSLIDTTLPAGDLSFISPNGTVEAGKYQIPFEIDIPSFLPGTMDESLNDGRCNIKYGVKAIVKGSGKIWNYFKEVPIILKAKPMDKLPPQPYNASPTTERVRCCCCFGRGQISFGARVNETRLAIGSPCTINVSLRNYSTAHVERFTARVMQDIWCTAGGYHRARRTTTLVSVEFPSVIEYAERQGRVNIAQVQNELKDIFDEIDNAKHQETLRLNPGALDTYHGSLITVNHTLELKVKTPCCISNPTLDVPIWIGQPPEFEQPPAVVYSPPVEEGAVQGPAFNITEEEIVVDPIADDPPSYERLSREMKDTASHLDMIERKIKKQEWDTVWKNMTPDQFGGLIGLVTSGFDQSRVAEALAKEIPDFRCAYVVAALKSGVDFERAAIVERLVPYATDLRENQGVIKKELTDWECLVTERAFAKALDGK